MKARFVYEELDFERGRDPQEAMEIGDNRVLMIKKLDRLAEKYGFVEAEFGPEHEEEGITNIKRWVIPDSDEDDGEEVVLFTEDYYDYPSIYFRSGWGGDGQDSVDDWIDEENWERHFGEGAGMNEQVRFNFDEPPYKKYISRKGISGPQVPNPRKAGYGGLTDEEKEIVERHQLKIQDLEDEVDLMVSEMDDLQREIESLENPPFDDMELEQFYADVQLSYGERALDILNSGMDREEKIEAIDKLSPAKDFGLEEYQDLVHNYEYYHPDEPDPEEIEKLRNKIKKIEVQRQERENTIEKLRTKIYNIENY